MVPKVDLPSQRKMILCKGVSRLVFPQFVMKAQWRPSSTFSQCGTSGHWRQNDWVYKERQGRCGAKNIHIKFCFLKNYHKWGILILCTDSVFMFYLSQQLTCDRMLRTRKYPSLLERQHHNLTRMMALACHCLEPHSTCDSEAWVWCYMTNLWSAGISK